MVYILKLFAYILKLSLLYKEKSLGYIKESKMKKTQKKRMTVQILAVILTIIGFFINYKIATGVIVLAGVFAGVFYCGWICPMGTFQDIFSRVGSALKIKKYKMPKGVQKYLKFSRYIITILVILLASDFIFSIVGLGPRNNLGRLLVGDAVGYLSIFVILSFMITSLFFERPFCNYFCMEGAKYGAMSSLRLFTIVRNSEKCIDLKNVIVFVL